MDVITAWIARTLGLDKMERQRRENDRLVLEIEDQQQADELATQEACP